MLSSRSVLRSASRSLTAVSRSSLRIVCIIGCFFYEIKIYRQMESIAIEGLLDHAGQTFVNCIGLQLFIGYSER